MKIEIITEMYQDQYGDTIKEVKIYTEINKEVIVFPLSYKLENGKVTAL